MLTHVVTKAVVAAAGLVLVGSSSGGVPASAGQHVTAGPAQKGALYATGGGCDSGMNTVTHMGWSICWDGPPPLPGCRILTTVPVLTIVGGPEVSGKAWGWQVYWCAKNGYVPPGPRLTWEQAQHLTQEQLQAAVMDQQQRGLRHSTNRPHAATIDRTGRN